jgi:hypothetical protein
VPSTGTLSATNISGTHLGTWNGSTIGVAYGGTGVTTSTGSGNNVLSNSPTLTTPTQASYEAWTGLSSAPTYAEGLLWYDSNLHALAYYNDSPNSIVHIGQDLQLKVINNTGATIANGSPVYITGTSSGQIYPNIALAKADVAATASVIGLTNGAIANGAIGYVTANGGIDNVNTGTFTVGQVLYLSPYSAGQLQNTIPPTGITVQVGVVSYVNSSIGKIYVKQTTPLSVPASIITGQVSVANGGTGTATPSLVAGTNITISGTWPNQTINSTGGGGGTSTYTRTSFTATASQTTFSVTYTAPYIAVYLNGVLLNATDYTATNGTSVVLSIAANAGDIVETIAYSTTSIGTPAGSNTQVQYNSGGSLGASSGFTFTGNDLNIPFGPSGAATSAANIALALSMIA